MYNYIKNLISLFPLLNGFLKASAKQKKFIQETLVLDIEQIKVGCDDTLGEKDFKKMLSYYGWAVAAILGESYSAYRGKPMSETERYALTYLGALTGLFDDFFDKIDTPEDHIKNLIENPHEDLARNSHELLFIRFYLKALMRSDNDDLRKYTIKVFEVQVHSKEQQEDSISPERLEKITLDKGGLSMLFFRSVFEEELSDLEGKMLYSMGAIGQVANDIFDVYDDYQDGIKTMITSATSIDLLRKYYKSLLQDTFDLVWETDSPKKNKRDFLKFFSLIACRGLVGLDFLEKSQKSTGNTFVIEKYSRKQLVCDMGKIGNVLRLCHYFACQKFN